MLLTPLFERHAAGIVGVGLLERRIEHVHALLIHRAQVALGILLEKEYMSMAKVIKSIFIFNMHVYRCIWISTLPLLRGALDAT